MRKTIPIVTTTDSSYVLNCYVMIFSIIKTSNKDDLYRIFVLMTDLSQEDVNVLESLSQENVSVKCMDIFELVKNAGLQQVSHFPIQTYYRMFIPLVLPEYKKILYLDSDLCVLRDVSQLFANDLDGYALGVVRDVPCPHLDWHDKELGGFSCEKTFNSGVLLIDTEIFEQNRVREKCLKILLEDYKREERKLIYADNDALNMVLYEKCKILDDAWNFQWQYLTDMEIIYESYRQRYQAAAQEPYIIHFASRIKPWTHPDHPMADIFWRFAEQTPILGELVCKNIVEMRKEKNRFDCFRIYRFPFEAVQADSKIAIYAAGQVGKALYDQMQILHYAKVVVWADKNYEKLQDKLPVDPPGILMEKAEEYQYIIIAVENKKIADAIMTELKEMGIAEKKLVWTRYRIKGQ